MFLPVDVQVQTSTQVTGGCGRCREYLTETVSVAFDSRGTPLTLTSTQRSFLRSVECFTP